MTASSAHRVWWASRCRPTARVSSTAGQVGRSGSGRCRLDGPAHAGGGVAARRRASEATASATARGSSGCGTAASARDHAASQASCGTPGEHEHRGAVVDLVVQLAADAEPAGGRGLPVQDEHVEAAGVHGAQQRRQGRELADLHQRQVGGGPAADGAADLLARRRLVAVQRHGQAAAVVGRQGATRCRRRAAGRRRRRRRTRPGWRLRSWAGIYRAPRSFPVRAPRTPARPPPGRAPRRRSAPGPTTGRGVVARSACPPIRLAPWQQQRQSARAHRRW